MKKRDRVLLIFIGMMVIGAESLIATPPSYLLDSVPSSWSVNDKIFIQDTPQHDVWWHGFDDHTLTQLIELACANNYSVLMAIDRVSMARAVLQQAKGAYSPSFSLNLGWQRQQTSGNISPSPQELLQYASGSISMSWEIDIFGRIRSQVRGSKASYEASKADYEATLVSLCAQVGVAYFSLRESQVLLEVTRRNVASQWAVVQITQKRYATGLVSELDVAQALSSYYSAQSMLPSIESSIVQYQNALGVLLGIYPSRMDSLVSGPAFLPDYIVPIAVGIPAQLLMRRPDIRQAEFTVAQQAAALGASRSDWWPSVYVNGSLGFASEQMDKFFNHESLVYEIAPTLSWTFFQGTQKIQASRQARAELEESIHQFNSTVLTAVQEVDNALDSYKNSVKEYVALKEVVLQGVKTLNLSLDLYVQGLTPFQNVLDAQRSLLSYESQFTQAQGASLIALVQLYQALGGGWSGIE